MYAENDCLILERIPTSADQFCFPSVAQLPISVAAQCKAWVCGRALDGIAVQNPACSMDVCPCQCCVLSGRGLCVELITRPEKSYRVWCV